ncbi:MULTISPECIES: DUF1489 family protein [unclassified Aureimonas]|uniref:DUF1489 family protein n=1 Tax=unclassified Aureimonas TaxID=2615206 RepID=UPI0007002A0F|nr:MULTISPECIES: DUF1489 family protein [unclassified Aureimonas]KQT60298.1 lysophospholipase [Aureimonas sp. Leaf427]KQT79174.1 lysophospholipase [Aureimonas sp. Leaf460]
MPLHMIKLCVGAESVEDLQSWVAHRLGEAAREGRVREQFHQTRMIPKRVDEVLDGGSLYWVIKGRVQVRQPILALRPIVDGEGIKRCHIVLEPRFVLTDPQPRRPFQGWRYLVPEEAPADLDSELGAALPADLRNELAELGLL